MNAQDLPAAFQQYHWDKKHALYGFGPDKAPDFP